MSDHSSQRSAGTKRDWIAALDAHGAAHGSHARLGAFHGALFTQDENVLLVTFEMASTMRAERPAQLPYGLEIAGKWGWSQLCLYSETDGFFRDPAVYSFFDKLIDNGFFEDFERVIFYGAGPRGYAAASFSIAAPEAEVLLLNPLATLDPAHAEWDRRFPEMRRTRFDDRFGYAPAMCETAESVWLVYDPMVPQDAMHASLFGRENVTRLRTPWLGSALETDLETMGVLGRLLMSIGRGKMRASIFHRLWRKRHSHSPYLRRILAQLIREERPRLTGIFARAASQVSGGQRMQRALQQAEAQLAEAGEELPPQHRPHAAE